MGEHVFDRSGRDPGLAAGASENRHRRSGAWQRVVAREVLSDGMGLRGLLFYVGILVWAAILGATLVAFFAAHVVSPEALASTLTVLVTVVLVYFSAQSVFAAKESADRMSDSVGAIKESTAHEIAISKADRTISLLKEYTQTRVPVTNTIALTVAEATSQAMMYSNQKLSELHALKAQFDSGSTEPQHEQYRVLQSSVPIVRDFYMVAMQLLRRDLLDVPLFMNTFALTFLPVYEAIKIINSVTESTAKELLERLEPFKEMAEIWSQRGDESPQSDS
jgi:hypothetical protein